MSLPLARNLSSTTTLLASLLGGGVGGDSTAPFGVDPAFLRSSTALYRPELAGHEAWFYDTTPQAGQVSAITGAPYGFFHRPLQVLPAHQQRPPTHSVLAVC